MIPSTKLDEDQTSLLVETVNRAIECRRPLNIVGGNTKHFYHEPGVGDVVSVSDHSGVLDYQPSELVVTARAGTPLAMIERLLAVHGQMLPFEPPHFGSAATLGGAVASGLSGPRRPYSGAVRDHVLGVKFINGLGQVLSMGGTVIKNVAGFDVARLMAGSLGTLGLLLEVSVRVVPRPEIEQTLSFACSGENVLATMARLGSGCRPISGLCHTDGRLYVRLAGGEAAVAQSCREIGGDMESAGETFWTNLNEQRHGFFAGTSALWRLSVPFSAEHPSWLSPGWIDWGGAQRWVVGDFADADVFDTAARLGGHAVLFRAAGRRNRTVQPMAGPLTALNRQIKQAFDPYGVFQSRRLIGEG